MLSTLSGRILSSVAVAILISGSADAADLVPRTATANGASVGISRSMVHEAVRLMVADENRSPTILAGSLGPSTLPNPAADGIALQIPGTHLSLTNGSAWLRHVADARRPKGAYCSVQLQY